MITGETRDSFGRVIERRGTFVVDVPLELVESGGEVTLPDGTIVRVSNGPTPDSQVSVGESAP